MKKFTSILIMITIIISAFIGIYNFIYYIAAPDAQAWVGVLFLILNAVIVTFGIMTLISINHQKRKKWLGISDLFLCLLIPGLLYLLCWDRIAKDANVETEDKTEVRRHRR